MRTLLKEDVRERLGENRVLSRLRTSIIGNKYILDWAWDSSAAWSNTIGSCFPSMGTPYNVYREKSTEWKHPIILYTSNNSIHWNKERAVACEHCVWCESHSGILSPRSTKCLHQPRILFIISTLFYIPYNRMVIEVFSLSEHNSVNTLLQTIKSYFWVVYSLPIHSIHIHFWSFES